MPGSPRYAATVTAIVTLSGSVYGNFILEPGDGFVIGRSLQSDLSVDDLRVSRRHCRIGFDEQGVTLADLQSANGTYVNGQRVAKALLRQGDRLQVGSADLAVQVSYGERTVPTRTYTCRECAREISLTTIAEGEVIQLDRGFVCPRCREKLETPAFSMVELNLIKRLHQEGFEVLEKLSISGVVPIYKARKTSLDQLVALKALPLSAIVSPKKVSRFAQEAKAQARLRHRNIVAIYDVRQTRDLVYIVMELVEGETLLQMIERVGTRLAVKDALRFTYNLARALAHAHEKGIVHRDIKPSNIMITRDAEAKLIDFGLAKNLYEVTMGITADGETLGTVGYMAPEQIRTAKQADQRADVYGLGATLYHCLAGRPPFTAPSEMALMQEISKGPSLDPLMGVPLNVVSLVVKMMQARPEARFASAAETLRAIEAVTSEMTGIRADANNVEFLLKVRDEESDLLQTWRSPVNRAAGFLGSFRGDELVEFLQMLEFNQKTGVLAVASLSLRGRLGIREGRIVRAEAGAARGTAAVGQILSQRTGDFEFTPGAVPGPGDCDIRISQALLDVMRDQDESGRLPRG